MPRLLIVLLEPLSDLVTKGEVVARDYNPGYILDDVHFLLLNADRPDPTTLCRMCGRARVAVYNLPLAPGQIYSHLFSFAKSPILDINACSN